MLRRIWTKNQLCNLVKALHTQNLACDVFEPRRSTRIFKSRQRFCLSSAVHSNCNIILFDDPNRRNMSSLSPCSGPPGGSCRDQINEFIKQNPVAVFSKSWCPYCKKAKDLLVNLGAVYKPWELDLDTNGDLIQAQLLELSGQKTVPNIYINQKHIGGFSDLNALYEKGELKPLLAEVITASSSGDQRSGGQLSEKVNSFITNNAVAVFSKSWCPFCQKTKNLLQGLGVNYEALELDKVADGEAIQAELMKLSGQKTVPNIFIHQKHVGGFSDLNSLHEAGELMNLIGDNLANKINGLIQTNEIVIFSKSWCPYCEKAKSLFNGLGVRYKALELDQEANGDAIQAKLLELSGQKTVPNIYINKKHIGGFSDLNALNESGNLKPVLSARTREAEAEAGDIFSVDDFIKSNQIAIFSKSWCPFCTKAKDLLDKHGASFHAVELDLLGQGDSIQKTLLEVSGQKTVPNIFINGKHIGGYSDLSALHSQGLLSEIIAGEDISRYEYDLIVIGGGSGGISAAKEAAAAKKKVALCDFVTPSPRGTIWGLGGTCVNVGCIPKKLMHRAAIIKQDIKDSIDFGWKLPGDILELSHSWETMVQNVQNYISSLNDSYLEQLEENKITYFNAHASLLDKHTVRIVGQDGMPGQITARNILIAVGGRPSHLDLPNAKELCITSDDIFSLKTPPGKTLVVGASYIALECAGFLKGLGYDVTVLVRSILLRGFDEECAGLIENFMDAYGVEFHKGCVPTSIEKVNNEGEPTKLLVKGKYDNGEAFAGLFDTVLVAVGRTAITDTLNLPKVGVQINPRNMKILVNERDQTTVSNIFAIGDVIERPELTPVAIQAGKLLAKRLFAGSEEAMDYTNVATTVFTPLEYGCVGLSEEDAIKRHGKDNVEVYLSTFTPLENSLRSWGTPETNNAFAKLICVKEAKEQYVIGLHILSPNAGEITQGFAMAVRLRLTKSQFDGLVGIHPTVAEVFTTLKVTKSSGEESTSKGC